MNLLKYALYCYNLIDDEQFCFDHEDKSKVVAEAIRRSSNDKNNYRIQMGMDGEFVGGMRFFHGGREITQDILNAIIIT